MKLIVVVSFLLVVATMCQQGAATSAADRRIRSPKQKSSKQAKVKAAKTKTKAQRRSKKNKKKRNGKTKKNGGGKNSKNKSRKKGAGGLGSSRAGPTSPSSTCFAVGTGAGVTDAWCTTNCFWTPPFCPVGICECTDGDDSDSNTNTTTTEAPLTTTTTTTTTTAPPADSACVNVWTDKKCGNRIRNADNEGKLEIFCT